MWSDLSGLWVPYNRKQDIIPESVRNVLPQTFLQLFPFGLLPAVLCCRIRVVVQTVRPFLPPADIVPVLPGT